MCVYVYTYTCPCARVNAISRPFFREGSQILSLHIYSMPTVSTISRPRLLVVHSVHRIYPGKRVCAQCLQTMQTVYKLCTVSTNYTRVNVYVHSVYKPRTVSTNYAQCPQTTRIRVCAHTFTLHIRRVYVYAYAYTRICIRVYM